MLKRWFDFSSNGNGVAAPGEHRNGYTEGTTAVMQMEEGECPSRPAPSPQPPEVHGAPPETGSDFEQIYKRAGIVPGARGILKVVEMVHSPHLSGMSPEGKRCAVRMALDAVGATVEGVLQDAVSRQSVLNDFEKEQQEKLRRFEETKGDENRRLQADLDKLTHEYMSRMQAAVDEVSREQDKFRAWQKRKELELQMIADSAALCVPESMGSHAIGLSGVLERACGARI
jgi:hypothetical protein